MKSERLLYCDHIDGHGEGLFRLACENDLEGIVAKGKSEPYLSEHARWLKIRNHDYSQWVGREELSNASAGAILNFMFGMDAWLRVQRQAISRPKTARSSHRFFRYTVRAWTLSASLTTSSSYRKCSKRRTLDHSAQATSLLQIEGTTRCSRIALGFGCGSISASAADLNLR